VVWHHDMQKTRCAITSQAASFNYPTENQPTFNTCSVAWMGILIHVGHILRMVQIINTAACLVRAHLVFCTSWCKTLIFAVLKAQLMWHVNCVLNWEVFFAFIFADFLIISNATVIQLCFLPQFGCHGNSVSLKILIAYLNSPTPKTILRSIVGPRLAFWVIQEIR